MISKNIEIFNRKAHYNYFVEDSYVAGIVLTGNEIKSIRNGNAGISESFCQIKNNEAILVNSHIEHYLEDRIHSGDEHRERKLLLNKKEIKKLAKASEQQGYTIIPLKLFINERGLCKCLIGLCKGKKDYDKRETIKERDLERNLRNIQ